MFYYASQTPYIKVLEPRVSNHGKPLVYFSRKRENTLVYLSNAVEKHCRENEFTHDGVYTKWGPYGFNRDGILVLDEYYPTRRGRLTRAYRGTYILRQKQASLWRTYLLLL